VRERDPDLVQALEEVLAARGIDVEVHRLAGGCRHGLGGQVDREPVPRVRHRLVEQPIDLELGQHDRQEPVLEAVVEEDIGVGRRDHGLEAVLLQRPRRVLA